MKFKLGILAALMLAVFCLSFGPSGAAALPAACAEDEDRPDLGIEVTVSPSEMVEPGKAALSFSVVNRTDSVLESLYLSTPEGELLEDIGDIQPDETKKFSREHDVTDGELNAGAVDYIVTCVSGRDHFSYPVRAAIVKAAAEPQVEFLRRISNVHVPESETAAVVYQINNIGNVSINNITVIDALGSFEEHSDRLEAGASAVFVQHVPVVGDAESAPVLTYSAASGTYTESLEPTALSRAHSRLSAVLTAAKSPESDGSAEVSLRLKNTGNVDYQNIVIYDDAYGGIIADSLALPAGSEPTEIRHRYPLREDAAYRWRITAQSSAGDSVDFVTNTAVVAYSPSSEHAQLSLHVEAEMPKISRRGLVPMRVEVKNGGGQSARGVVLNEESQGELYTFAVIPTGDATIYRYNLDVRDDVVLNYFLTWEDEDGRLQTISASPVSVDIGRGGEMPLIDESQPSLFGGLSTQIHESKLFMVLFYSSVAVLVVLIGVLIVAAHRQRSQRRERDAARKQRQKEDMAKTAPFHPLRKNSENKK